MANGKANNQSKPIKFSQKKGLKTPKAAIIACTKRNS